jgi:CelD/BcsL family acetyltransferase involved in cellulose biosynthesis
MPPRVEATLRVETVSSEAGLIGLAGRWDDLVRAMRRPSPFLLHAWLVEWWRHYGAGAQLEVHVAYRGERLVGALPLHSRRRLGVRITKFVGGPVLADLLLAPDEDGATAAALVDRATSSGADFANLFGLSDSSPLVETLPPGTLRLIQRLEAPVMEMPGGWEPEYRARFSSKARSERRRRLRKLSERGPLEVLVARTRAELGPAIEDAYHVHAQRWQGRRDMSGFTTPTGQRFHRAVVLALADLDVPRITVVRCGGQPIAFAFSLHFAGATYGVAMAFDPAYAAFGPGLEAKLTSIEAASAEGLTRVELLGADAPHKRRLTDRFEPVYQGVGLAQTARGRAACEGLLAAIRVRRVLKRSQAARRLYERVPRLPRS